MFQGLMISGKYPFHVILGLLKDRSLILFSFQYDTRNIKNMKHETYLSVR